MFFGGRKEECELCGRKMTDKTRGAGIYACPENFYYVKCSVCKKKIMLCAPCFSHSHGCPYCGGPFDITKSEYYPGI